MAPSPVTTAVALALGATAAEAFVAPGLRAQGSVSAEARVADRIAAPAAAEAEVSVHGFFGIAGASTAAAAALVAGGRRLQRKAAPAKPVTVVKAFENETGVQPPVGFWDPAGFTSEGNELEFFRRRCVELKHGRVSMLACLGYIVPEYFKFPGYLAPSIGLKFSDVPNGIAALSKVPGIGWFQIVLFGGLCDLFLTHQEPFEEPGKLRTRLFGGDFSNYEYGAFGIPGYLGGKTIEDPEIRKKKLNAELANGRLAMTAIMAMLFQNGTVGTTGPEMWLPSSAFETELGVQAPVGFWDPLGFTKGMDAASFRRRRAVELKHGRVSMLACMGYITPEYYKFEGYLSPSADLKFSDVPNGLAAISKIPGSGIAQFITFAGLVELFFLADDESRAPGDFANAGGLGIPLAGGIKDEATKKKKLSAEIANGRLAMMAIIGMFFQDGLTGSAWGDWSLYTASPLRAEGPKVLQGTGGPLPENFWDPAGLAKGKSDEQLLYWRAVELKHGRVSMLAVLGWFHVAAGWHPIGDAAARTRVSDDPLINVTQLPMAGAWQVVFTIMCFEWASTYVCPPPKDAPWDVLGWDRVLAKSDDDSWEQAQLRELNNGRLAMVGIIGLISQDMLTGDYFPGIAKPCFGNVVCQGGWDFATPFPKTPFVMPPLYPSA